MATVLIAGPTVTLLNGVGVNDVITSRRITVDIGLPLQFLVFFCERFIDIA